MVLTDGEQRSASLADERVTRRARQQAEAYAAELQTLIDAAFAVVGRTGSLDPPVREILREAGVSNQALYRHVESKDELLLLMLDEGRRELVRYLDARMVACAGPSVRLREWIRGVLAQAADVSAARRTRPFVANVDRLAQQFPDEQRRSEDLLVDQLAAAADLDPAAALAIYDLAFGALARHLRRHTAPTESDIESLTALAGRIAA